jgi:hypothetical protein
MSDLSILPPFFFLLEEGVEVAEDDAFFVLSVEQHHGTREIASALVNAPPCRFSAYGPASLQVHQLEESLTVLAPPLDLLPHLPGLALIRKHESDIRFLGSKGMEKASVLVVRPSRGGG